MAGGKEEQIEKRMIKRGYCSGRTRAEHIFVMEGLKNLYKFVWSTGGVELARKESRTWKWKMFTQDPRQNQVRREMIMRKLGIKASPIEDEKELVYSVRYHGKDLGISSCGMELLWERTRSSTCTCWTRRSGKGNWDAKDGRP